MMLGIATFKWHNAKTQKSTRVPFYCKTLLVRFQNKTFKVRAVHTVPLSARPAAKETDQNEKAGLPISHAEVSSLKDEFIYRSIC